MALIADVVAGTTISATWGNNIRNATVQVTTSGARPSSPSEGMVIYETDTDYLMMYTGAAWRYVCNSGAWTSYAPTFGGAVTPGNGTVTGAYTRVGQSVLWRARIVFGSTSTMGTGTPTVTLPVTAAALEPAGHGMVNFFNQSDGVVTGWSKGFLIYGTTIASLLRGAAGGSYLDSGALSSTIPFSWTTSDEIQVSGSYEAA